MKLSDVHENELMMNNDNSQWTSCWTDPTNGLLVGPVNGPSDGLIDGLSFTTDNDGSRQIAIDNDAQRWLTMYNNE